MTRRESRSYARDHLREFTIKRYYNNSHDNTATVRAVCSRARGFFQNCLRREKIAKERTTRRKIIEVRARERRRRTTKSNTGGSNEDKPIFITIDDRALRVWVYVWCQGQPGATYPANGVGILYAAPARMCT
jgi:hypothetical protein